MRHVQYMVLVVALMAAALAAQLAWGFAHLWDIKEIYTNHDGTVQFIELKTPTTGANSENFLNGQTLKATSTVGGVAQPTVTFTFPLPNPVGGTNNKHLLVATSTFATHLPSVTPNYNTLPASFFVPDADSVTIVFSAGFQESVTMMGSAIPKDGVNSLTDANLFGTPNLVAGTNSPTNFAGATGSLNLPPPTEPSGDYNGNGVVDAADYTEWRDTHGQTVAMAGDGADGDQSGEVDAGDYDYWVERFGNVVPDGSGSAYLAPGDSPGANLAAVPEPATFVTAMLAMLAIVATRMPRGQTSSAAG